MASIPEPVVQFLHGKRIAVAGVSRQPNQPANAVYRKLQNCGYEVLAVNPKASTVEAAICFPDLGSIPGPIDGVVVVTPAQAAAGVVRQCAARGINRVWFHRSIGQGSVSREAVRECGAHGIHCIVGGCPLMYCEPVDPGHRCMRSVLRFLGRVPG